MQTYFASPAIFIEVFIHAFERRLAAFVVARAAAKLAGSLLFAVDARFVFLSSIYRCRGRCCWGPDFSRYLLAIQNCSIFDTLKVPKRMSCSQ